MALKTEVFLGEISEMIAALHDERTKLVSQMERADVQIASLELASKLYGRRPDPQAPSAEDD